MPSSKKSPTDTKVSKSNKERSKSEKKSEKKAKKSTEKKPKKEKKSKKDKKIKNKSSKPDSDSEGSLKADDLLKSPPPASSNNASANLSGSANLGGSSSRMVNIDPNSRALPKLDRPPLPILDETPDWLFQPNEEAQNKKVGLGIAGRMAEERKLEKEKSNRKIGLPSSNADVSDASREFASSFMKHLQSDKKLAKELVVDKKAKPAARLFDLLNLDPWDRKAPYHDELVRDLMKKHPEVCMQQYDFEATTEAKYPFSMLCALGASVKTLKSCAQAYPAAVTINDKWVGTSLHYACSYRAPLDVLKFLEDYDDNLLKSENQMKRRPLHLACMVLTPLENIAFLVKCDKSALKVGDKDGMTPLHWACNRTDPDPKVIEFLATKYSKACVMQNEKGSTPLHLAVQHGTPLPILETLLAANDKAFSIADKMGNLPIHTSLHYSADKAVIQFLVWNYSDGLSHYNERDERPIDMARRIRKKDTALHEILEPG